MLNEVKVRELGVVGKYTEAFKLEVVNDVLSTGLGIVAARRKYGIKGHGTIRTWLNKYGSSKQSKAKQMKKQEQISIVEVEKLRREKKELEVALLKASVKVSCLESILERAEIDYGADFKKSITQQ